MRKNTETNFWTLPNCISILRILLIPVFLFLMIHHKVQEAFAVFLLASFTDILDGLTARLWHQKTQIGALLDPAADKSLMTASFIILSFPSLNSPHLIPLWLTITVISRDVLIVSGAFIAYKLRGINRFPPSIWGKTCTVLEMTVILAVLFLNSRKIFFSYLSWLYYLTFAFTLISAIHYSSVGSKMVFHNEKA